MRDRSHVSCTLFRMRPRYVTSPNPSVGALVAGIALALHTATLLLPRPFRTLSRFALVPWLLVVAYVSSGIHILSFGGLAFVEGRVMRLSSIVCIETTHVGAPGPMRKEKPLAWLLLHDGSRLALRCDPGPASAALGVSLQSAR
jgi:hypothetical protein